jgi:hypothetical protein
MIGIFGQLNHTAVPLNNSPTVFGTPPSDVEIGTWVTLILFDCPRGIAVSKKNEKDEVGVLFETMTGITRIELPISLLRVIAVEPPPSPEPPPLSEVVIAMERGAPRRKKK